MNFDNEFVEFLSERVTEEDRRLLGSLTCEYDPGTIPPWPPLPAMTIAPSGKPYLYRWRLTPKGVGANVLLHLQVASDPERPLHDHPWDNQSVILAGGYDEQLSNSLPIGHPDCKEVKFYYERGAPGAFVRHLRKGSVVHRKAEEAHRLILPPEIPYTISLFTTGPKTREWGFYMPEGWRCADEVFKERDF